MTPDILSHTLQMLWRQPCGHKGNRYSDTHSFLSFFLPQPVVAVDVPAYKEEVDELGRPVSKLPSVLMPRPWFLFSTVLCLLFVRVREDWNAWLYFAFKLYPRSCLFMHGSLVNRQCKITFCSFIPSFFFFCESLPLHSFSKETAESFKVGRVSRGFIK